MDGTWRIGSIAGIPITIHPTWLLALILFTWSLAGARFPQEYPGWPQAQYYVVGTMGALGLFVSVLIHELAHSFVARARGLPVSGITLFIFGGVSQIAAEAASAGDEFKVAFVGPLTSFILAGLFWLAQGIVPDPTSPVKALASYLTYINFGLGVFNLVPGYPLDGGRVLRSIIWASTGQMEKATNTASVVGQVIAWGMILWGIVQVLSGDLGGLWIAFIGWFLNNAAESSRREMQTQRLFSGIRVRHFMDPNPTTIPPDTTVDTFVQSFVLGRGIRAVPVADDRGLAGIVSLSDVRELPSERWPTTPVSEVMTREPLHQASPDTSIGQALGLIVQNDVHQLLVTENGRLVGLLNRTHLLERLEFREELGILGRSAARR